MRSVQPEYLRHGVVMEGVVGPASGWGPGVMTGSRSVGSYPHSSQDGHRPPREQHRLRHGLRTAPETQATCVTWTQLQRGLAAPRPFGFLSSSSQASREAYTASLSPWAATTQCYTLGGF